ncbi:MAG: acyl carrier protein [Myxococcaceae bacterium]
MDELTVLQEIRRIARRELQLPHEAQPSDRLVDDLQLDSLGMIVLAVGLEDRFRITLTTEDAVTVTTVEDLALLVARRCNDEASEGAVR